MLSSLSFASPLILAALAGLPAIWLLLRATPPAPKRASFPPFDILRRLQTKEETPQRTPLLLLLLRLGLAALAILGLAGPVLNAGKPTASDGPLVFVVDDSWAAARDWRLRQDAMAAGVDAAARSGRIVFILTTAAPRPDALVGPLTGEEARERALTLEPQPLRSDRAGALGRLKELKESLDRLGGRAEIRWLSDGLAGPADREFESALAAMGDLSIFAEPRAIALRAIPATGEPQSYRIERLDGAAPWTGALVATSRRGRELARAPVQLPTGSLAADTPIDLPLALRNEVAAVAVEDVTSAGAVQLVDARERRALIGLIAGADGPADDLASGGYFIRRALAPYAEFVDAPLDDLLKSKVSVIVLDDIGRLRAGDVESLTAWIESGGVAIRFAGPNLADAAQDADPPLLPVKLRGGGRAFGGALTWETPQKLAAFSPDGPFADFPVPDDVFVREQVLAVPGGETSERSWASLADGTPIVTGMRIGSGALALFHAPATPNWSDLPISATFVEMLRRLAYLSLLGPAREEAAAGARLAPHRVLDGFGRLPRPPP
ncbi:MAG: BatA domain-containing protein, partial [Parvularculaceae bacterium]|nr:BatA domain-containing protein [Parvularculaceae bacterium]